MHKNQIWELPIRLFHWLVALLVFGLLGSGFVGATEQHIMLGQVLLAFLIFRIIWGFCGGYYTRFSTGLKIILGKTEYDGFGHTKTGWLSTFAIIGFLLAHVIMGMFATTDEILAGPWSKFLNYDLSRTMAFIHGEIGVKIIILLIIAHILAVMYYLNDKNPQIVGSMFHGNRDSDTKAKPMVYSLGWFAVVAVMTIVITIFLINIPKIPNSLNEIQAIRWILGIGGA